MKRWDGLPEWYLALQETRGVAVSTIKQRESELS